METSFQYMDVRQLRFDPNNPRIPKRVDSFDEIHVLNWMLEDAGLVELMGSIAVNGFFPAEPLLVCSNGDDKYIVLEGNRRLAAVKLLLSPSMAPKRRAAVREMATLVTDDRSLRQLPVAVFESRTDVLDYLGFRHITGIKEWEPAAKAKYLEELYNEHREAHGGDVYRHIARIIGSRADYVARLLGSLRLYELIVDDEDLAEQDVNESTIAFSLLTLALNYRSIVQFLGLNRLEQSEFGSIFMGAVKDLAIWLFSPNTESGRTTLGESRNMKLLAAAVSSDAGLDALRGGATAEEAAEASVDLAEVLERSLRQIRARLISTTSLVARSDPGTHAIELSGEVRDAAASLHEEILRSSGEAKAARD